MTACSRDPDLPRGLEDSDIDAVARQQDETCSLLTEEELELAVNAPLDNEDPRPRAIFVGMSMCGLTANPHSSASWGVLLKEGASRFSAYEHWNEQYVEKIRGIGDEALWDERLGTLIVRKSDMALGIRLTVKDPPVSEEIERRSYVEQTAKVLAAKLLRRL